MKKYLYRTTAKIRDISYTIINKLTNKNKINNEYLYFDSFAGKDFNDNPYYIFKYLFHNYPNYNFIWAFKSNEKMLEFKKQYPNDNVIVVKYKSLQHFKYLNKAILWIVNYKTPPYFKKNKNSIYLQTWHGIPLKKLGCDIEDKNQTFYRSHQTYQQMCNTYQDEAIKCNYFIGPSKYACDKFISAFHLDKNKLVKVGYPRNEQLYLYKDDQQLKTSLKNTLGLKKKVILYAPTWRDDNSNLSGYKSNNNLNFDLFYQELKDNYQIIYRPHYLIKEKIDLSKYQDFIIDASEYTNLSDLMLVSDALITDYSSIYFDYAILKRPIYFFMNDLENYQDNLRGFYIDINNDLPNDYYTNEEFLIEDIKHDKINQEKWQRFLKNNLNYNLSYQFIDEIMNEINNK